MLAINYLLRVAIVIGFFGASCKNGNIDSEDENAPKIETNLQEQKQNDGGKLKPDTFRGLDSVSVSIFFAGKSHNEYFEVHFKSEGYGTEFRSEDIIIPLQRDDTIAELIKYINIFFVKRETPIVTATGTMPAPVTDYPVVLVVGYQNNSEKFKESVVLAANKTFHPNFLKFYELLLSLQTRIIGKYD